MPVSSPPLIQVPTAFQGLLIGDDRLTSSSAVPTEFEDSAEAEGDLSGPTTLVGVATAASRLGVHENTIRNWADRGILKAVRLPGGHRRVESREIERIRSEIFGQSDVDVDEENLPSQGHLHGRIKPASRDEGW